MIENIKENFKEYYKVSYALVVIIHVLLIAIIIAIFSKEQGFYLMFEDIKNDSKYFQYFYEISDEFIYQEGVTDAIHVYKYKDEIFYVRQSVNEQKLLGDENSNIKYLYSLYTNEYNDENNDSLNSSDMIKTTVFLVGENLKLDYKIYNIDFLKLLYEKENLTGVQSVLFTLNNLIKFYFYEDTIGLIVSALLTIVIIDGFFRVIFKVIFLGIYFSIKKRKNDKIDSFSNISLDLILNTDIVIKNKMIDKKQ